MAVALLLGGCAVGGGGDEDEAGGFRDENAEEARPLTTDPVAGAPTGEDTTSTTAVRNGTATTTRSTPSGGSGSGGSGNGSGSGAGGGGGQATTTTVRPFVTRLDVADAAGDPGLEKPPAYGDLTRLRMEEDGTGVRFTVELAGDVPARAAEGEQVTVAVDLFRGGTESEYQVFALGTDEGWRAWLDTPEDDVPYPGTFELGGRFLVFTVPWSSLGGRRAGSLSSTVEWTKDRTVVLASASRDDVPDRGTQPYSL